MKTLYQGQPGISVETLYSITNANTSSIKTIIACNTTASESNFSIYLVKNNESASLNNVIFYENAVPPKSSLVLDTANLQIDAGSYLAGKQGTANAITLLVQSL